MKLRRNKKGFTIVELVIVIAVIGVLAAVLIPTFINLTDKANKAADDSLVKNLNTALATQEGVPGDTKNNTLHDAVIELEEYGYKLPNLVTKSGENSLLWNRKTNRFLLEKDIAADQSANKTVNVDYFHIQDNNDATKGYSIYAGNGFNESNPVDVSVGFDVGFKTFSAINYSHTSGEGQEVVIRTSSARTSLTVNAPNDTIHHYDNAGSVDIIAVANKSYHENGNVAFLEIAKGRVSLENESKVKQIHVSTKINSVAEDGTKTKEANTFDKVIVALASGVETPDFSRDEVALSSITAEGKLVVEIEKENNQSDYVYLHQQGLVEQIKVTTGASTNSADNVEAKAIDGDAKTGNDESLSSNTSSIATDIANNLKAGSTATPEQIAAGTVDTTDIEETGLNETVKEETKSEATQSAVIEEIETDDKYVARIGTTPYESLKDAVAGAVTNDVIEMTANDASTESVSVDKRVTINMNEKTFGGTIVVNVSNSYVTVNGAANIDAMSRIGNDYYKGLSVINNREVFLLKDVTLNSLNVGTTANWIFNLNGHKMTIGSARIQNDGTRGTLTLRNGDVRFTSTGNQSIEVNGTLIMDNINILESKANMVIKTIPMSWGDGSPIVQISNCTINSDKGGIENSYLNSTSSWSPSKVGSLTISNSTINANNGKGICNYGQITIENCIINAQEDCSIYSLHHVLDVWVVVNGSNTFTVLTTKQGASSNNVEIQGGTFTINGNVSFASERQNSDNAITDLVVNGATATINGGSYESMTSSLGGSGNLRITNGTFVNLDVFVTGGGNLLVLGNDEYDGIHHYIVNGSNGVYSIEQE